jgi:carbon-monoxide dehydrogenase medium subunit
MNKVIQSESLQGALAALEQYGDEAKILAGGTAVVLMLQKGLINPDYLISLGRLTELAYINNDEEGLHIGAMTSLSEISGSELVNEKASLISKACGVVGNIRVRNQATIGGNLAEADYSSDPPAALLALNARVRVANKKGTREIDLKDFILGFYTTAIEQDEIIVEVLIPTLASNHRSSYFKFKSRSSEDRACVGVAVIANFEKDICIDLRLAIGAASEIPQRLNALEALAIGKKINPKIIADISEGYAEEVDTLDDMRGSAWYRKEMIRVHAKRVLEEITNGNR